jgi:hypothetical protein
MSNITIENLAETDTGWTCTVHVDDTTCLVTIDRGHWQELTDGAEPVEELVRRSFLFLLDREPLNAILQEFNLRDIERYFPEYRVIMKTSA